MEHAQLDGTGIKITPHLQVPRLPAILELEEYRLQSLTTQQPARQTTLHMRVALKKAKGVNPAQTVSNPEQARHYLLKQNNETKMVFFFFSISQ